MMASDILMAMGSTTASMLKGPMSLSPTAMRLSRNCKIRSEVVWRPGFEYLNRDDSDGDWLNGSYRYIYPSCLIVLSGMPGNPSSHCYSMKNKVWWQEVLDKRDIESSLLKPPRTCLWAGSWGSWSTSSCLLEEPGKMFLWQRNFFSIEVSTF